MEGYPVPFSTSQPDIKRSGIPIMPPISVPNMSPKPKIQNTIVPREKSRKFFITILPAFFARVSPVSTIAKPGCMKKTKAAPKSTHIVSTELYTPFINTNSFMYTLPPCSAPKNRKRRRADMLRGRRRCLCLYKINMYTI